MNGPETRYVSVGDADVAYQVLGEGPLDLLYFYGMGSHIEFAWESQAYAEFFMRLASFSRLIMFDRRGTGSSDGISRSAIPTWEEWTEDIVAVLDAAGSRRAAILAATDSGPIAILLAAMHPEMVSALVLFNTTARYLEADDYPIGAPPEAVDATVQLIATGWGTNELTRLANPSMADDAEWIRFTSKAIRSSATPRTAAAQFNYILRNDVRQALPLIQAPTLVLHAQENALVPIAHGRYLAERIDGATFVELPGGDSTTTPELYVIADEVAEFLTGERPVVEVERILTTVVFTDIVGSTARAASLGDRRWRSLLDAHDRTVRDELRRFRGREINTTGDASWHLSTALREPYAARRRSLKAPGSSASSCESGCIRVSATFVERTSEGSRSISPPAWEPWRVPERSLSPGLSKTSSWDRESSSSIVAIMNSGASQGPGSCLPSWADI